MGRGDRFYHREVCCSITKICNSINQFRQNSLRFVIVIVFSYNTNTKEDKTMETTQVIYEFYHMSYHSCKPFSVQHGVTYPPLAWERLLDLLYHQSILELRQNTSVVVKHLKIYITDWSILWQFHYNWFELEYYFFNHQ